MVTARIRVSVRFEFEATVRECRDYNLTSFHHRPPGGYTRRLKNEYQFIILRQLTVPDANAAVCQLPFIRLSVCRCV